MILLPVKSSHKRLLINGLNERSPDLFYFTLNFTSNLPASDLSPFWPMTLPTSFNTHGYFGQHRKSLKTRVRVWFWIHKYWSRNKDTSFQKQLSFSAGRCEIGQPVNPVLGKIFNKFAESSVKEKNNWDDPSETKLY